MRKSSSDLLIEKVKDESRMSLLSSSGIRPVDNTVSISLSATARVCGRTFAWTSPFPHRGKFIRFILTSIAW